MNLWKHSPLYEKGKKENQNSAMETTIQYTYYCFTLCFNATQKSKIQQTIVYSKGHNIG